MGPLRYILIPLLTWLFAPLAAAQGSQVRLYGQVKELDTHVAIADVALVATDMEEATFWIEDVSDSTGSYAMLLPYDRQYKVQFSADGLVPRHVLIDLRNIPAHLRSGGFDLLMDPVLFRQIDDVDHSLFQEEAAGICLYDPKQRTLVWDPAYIESTKKLVQAALEEHRSGQ